MINSRTEAVLNKYDYRIFTERCLDAVNQGHEVPHAVEFLSNGTFKVSLLMEDTANVLTGLDENI